MSDSLFRLSDGIYIENKNILIPWNSKVEKLEKTDSPKKSQSEDRISLGWQKDYTWLGGLQSSFHTIFYFSSGAGKVNIISEGLRMMEFYTKGGGTSPRTEYPKVKEYICDVLGKPTKEESPDYTHYKLPIVEWDLDDVFFVYMIFERFGEYCVGEVWHKPIPSWRLRN